MKIALLGYGKMGKTIERLSVKRGHEIALIVNGPEDEFNFNNVDVAIDFSLPSSAVNNIKNSINNGVPVVSGTTGWLDDYEDVVNYCKSEKGSFLYASNFSLGVNIFFELNRTLAKLMSNTQGYKLSIEEIHHTQKLDAPSGTAISLAEQIIHESEYQNWALDESVSADQIPITAKRIEHVPGTHIINYSSDIDSIEISHVANNRDGFALGAIIAAEWIKDRKGVFSMKDVLNIG